MINSEGVSASATSAANATTAFTVTATATTTPTTTPVYPAPPSTPSTPLISVIGDPPDAVNGHPDADVFSNAPTTSETRVKPQSKKRKKVVISNSSIEKGDSDDDEEVMEAMEEGELDRSSQVEDLNASTKETSDQKNASVFEKTLSKILKECKSLRSEIEVLRNEKTTSRKETEKIVREILAKEKKIWMAEVKKDNRSEILVCDK